MKSAKFVMHNMPLTRKGSFNSESARKLSTWDVKCVSTGRRKIVNGFGELVMFLEKESAIHRRKVHAEKWGD